VRYDAGGALTDFLGAYQDAGAPFGCDTNPGEDFSRWDTRALSALSSFYGISAGNWSNGWWTSANAVEAAADSIERNQGQSFAFLMKETFNVNSSAHFLNSYYDDEGWRASAWIRAYDLTGDGTYLQMADTIFQDMTGGWDTTCGGGLWWSKDKTLKNAIPNELFLLVAASLHNRMPGSGTTESHLTWALKEWDWFKASGMINAQGLVNDGLTSACANNGEQTWTYNQGVILGGLVELYKATGDASLIAAAERIASATLTHKVTSWGILSESCEPTCTGDNVQFKGPFTRNLERLYDVDQNPSYLSFLTENARSIWNAGNDGSDHLGLVWSGPFDSADYVRQNSAMVTLSAVARDQTQTAPLAEPATSPIFCHGAGAASGAAWACDAKSCPTPGFMMNGPYVSSLSLGKHTVHVTLAVSSLSTTPVPLALVDVYDPALQKVVATSPVLLWSDFKVAGAGHDVPLTFNAKPDEPLEFRVFWGAPSEGPQVATAPQLTIQDVIVDASGATGVSLSHELGRLDGQGRWEVDTARDPDGGVMLLGPTLDQMPAPSATAWFELKAEPQGTGTSPIATLAVIDGATGDAVASAQVSRSSFPNALYKAFPVNFTAEPGHVYSASVSWTSPSAPMRLTARGVYFRPTLADTQVALTYNLRGIGTQAGDANLDGFGFALAAQELQTNESFRGHVFTLGPTAAGKANVLAGGPGVTAPLPNGSAAVVHLLLVAVNGNQVGQSFGVTYTDGSQSTFTLDLPDWFAANPTPGVDFAVGMPLRWSGSGPSYGNMHVLHAALAVDPTKTVKGLVLPNNVHVKVLAATLSQTD
jgi:predicted alpha-1,6-mannanase (GH76 family)